MTRLFVSIFILGAVWIHAEDRRPDPQRLTVMTFNAEFLWDGEAPEDGNPKVKFPWKGDPEAARKHMAAVAEVIRRHNPDMVNLVEVESLVALETFNRGFLADSGYRAYLVDGKDDFTGQDLGLLTRVDPVAALDREDRKGTSGDTTKSVSKNYTARFEVDGVKLALVGIHLLAQPDNPDRKPQREAQADAVRLRTRDLLADGYQLIVLGDFNDWDARIPDHLDHRPISRVLEILADVSDDDTRDLQSVAGRLPKAERYTNFWDQNKNGEIDRPQEFSTLDHILLSPELARRIERVAVDHTHDPRKVSDHYPLMVTLRLKGDPPPRGPRIVALLPNPEGNERFHETATLLNDGSEEVPMRGWVLRDSTGRIWRLDSMVGLPPGTPRTILRAGQAMGLNNAGDTVYLVDPAGVVVDTVVYKEAASGQTVTF